MKSLSIEKMEEMNGGQNCGAIYNSCLTVAGLTGAAVIVSTGGWLSYFGVALAAAGMEYCRQQAIGCYQTAS